MWSGSAKRLRWLLLPRVPPPRCLHLRPLRWQRPWHLRLSPLRLCALLFLHRPLCPCVPLFSHRLSRGLLQFLRPRSHVLRRLAPRRLRLLPSCLRARLWLLRLLCPQRHRLPCQRLRWSGLPLRLSHRLLRLHRSRRLPRCQLAPSHLLRCLGLLPKCLPARRSLLDLDPDR